MQFSAPEIFASKHSLDLNPDHKVWVTCGSKCRTPARAADDLKQHLIGMFSEMQKSVIVGPFTSGANGSVPCASHPKAL